MSVTLSQKWVCDLCDAELFEATEVTYYNMSEVRIPTLQRHQWRPHGGCYDLCEACAEPMSSLFSKLYAAAFANREAAKAKSEAAA